MVSGKWQVLSGKWQVAPLPRTPQVYPEKVKHRKLDDSEFNPIASNYQPAQVSCAELESKLREEEAMAYVSSQAPSVEAGV